MDRDSIFSAEVCRVLRPMEVRPVRTSVQSPWQNGVAERWVGSCRRELLDHVIVLNKQHRHRMLHEDLESYHNDRTSLSDLLHPTNRAATPCRSHHLFRLALARSSDHAASDHAWWTRQCRKVGAGGESAGACSQVGLLSRFHLPPPPRRAGRGK